MNMRRLRTLPDPLTVGLRTLSVVLGFSIGAGAVDRQAVHGAVTRSAHSIPGDRWLEIDLYWFEQKDIAGSVRVFWDHFQPLYAGVQGYRGVILNIGWTVSCVMEWSGDLAQTISLPRGSGEQHWVDERGPLRGTTEERKRQAQARFAKSQTLPHRGYDPWTYGDVKKLASILREEAAKRGIPAFKVGMLNYAWTNAYGEEPDWVRRHREAFTLWQPASPGGSPFGSYFDPSAKLPADSARLGGLPKGITEGMPVHEAYAAQWGSLSKTVGLDALMLRDSFGMPVPYQRRGPWGPLARSAEVIRQATAGVAALVRELKTANPQAVLMMYSNAASAVADWHANGLDLESVAKEGYLDIFVDQTWAGAWNEVGLRETDSEDWGGSGAGYALVAGALNFLLSGSAALHAEEIDLDQTVNVAAWRAKDGMLRILAANLEEGLRDDTDLTRQAIIVLPRSWKATKWTDAWSHHTLESVSSRLPIKLEQASSILIQPATQ